jgi:hypothetical protein
MNTELSITFTIDMPSGSAFSSSATAASTPSTTATVFDPPCFCTSSVIEGIPSTRVSVRASAVVSSTRPTSATRICVPCGPVISTTSSIARGSSKRPTALSPTSLVPATRRPAGRS